MSFVRALKKVRPIWIILAWTRHEAVFQDQFNRQVSRRRFDRFAFGSNWFVIVFVFNSFQRKFYGSLCISLPSPAIIISLYGKNSKRILNTEKNEFFLCAIDLHLAQPNKQHFNFTHNRQRISLISYLIARIWSTTDGCTHFI